jgi:gliding motility-associated-like protein
MIRKNYLPLFFFLSLFISISEKSSGQIFINEYCGANVSLGNDNFGNSSDWLELYNAGTSSVSLTGYYLSDKISNPTKWAFPAGVSIPGNGFLRVWCSGRNVVSGSNVHAGFSLTQTKPEQLAFSDPSGNIIDSMTIRPNQKNHSRARTTNGGNTWGVATTPTPGASNTSVKLDYATTPAMSVEAGFYPGAQTVTISSPDASVSIYYTTNGSVPTSGSTLYSGPVNISATTVLRARAFSSNAQVPASFVKSNTYFINSSHTIPVVSIFGDQTATLLNGNQINPETGLEYFDETKAIVAETDGEANEHGNDSWSYNQRGFDFVSKDEFGYNYGINYKIFSNKQRKSFQRIIFKAAANDNYPFETGGAHIRDSYAHTLAQRGGLNLDARTWKPSIVYVNGQYWGVYDTREKVDDADFTDYYYGQDEPFIEYLQTWGSTWEAFSPTPGQATSDWNSISNYITSNNMAVQANYDYVDSIFNTKSFVDYFVYNSWLVTMDWLNWNTAWWRGMDPAGDKKKWRYTLWDLDAILGHYVNYTGIPDESAGADPCNVESVSPSGSQGHTEILNALMANPGFKQYYESRYIDLMNTSLSCDFALPLYDSMIAVITPEMQGQVNKWGGSFSGWQNNANRFRDSIDARCTKLTQGLVDCYNLTGPFAITYNVTPAGAGNIKINSVTPASYVFTGNYFGGIITKLKATPMNSTYVFDHWEINNDTLTTPVTSDSTQVTYTQANDVVAVFRLVTEPPIVINPPPVPDDEVAIPTAFSPNSDGNNDLLLILGSITDIDFSIYNRWGQLVFHTNDKTVGWDGTFNGLPLNAGVFAYHLSGKIPDGGSVDRKGNVTLVR